MNTREIASEYLASARRELLSLRFYDCSFTLQYVLLFDAYLFRAPHEKYYGGIVEEKWNETSVRRPFIE